MKIEMKAIVIILALTIGLSAFMGLTMAAPPAKKAQAVILGSYSGNKLSTSTGGGVVETAEITTNKPAIFTVTVSVTGFVDTGGTVWLAQSVNQGAWSTNVGQPITYPDNNCMTLTVAGYGVSLTYLDLTAANMNIRFCIIVQGEADTVVTVGT